MINENEWIKSLREIKKILDKIEIRYWLDHGTLLGVVRDGKLIPWDTDIDIGIFHSEAKKVIKKIPELEKKGYKVDVTDSSIYLSKLPIAIGLGFYRTEKDKAWALSGIIMPKYFTELFRYLYLIAIRLLYKDLYRVKSAKMRFIFFIIPSFCLKLFRKFLFKICEIFGQKYCTFIFPRHYLENLEETILYDMVFNIPSFSHEYLKLLYGKTWQKPNKNWHSETKINGPSIKTTKKVDCNFFKNRDREKYSLI